MKTVSSLVMGVVVLMVYSNVAFASAGIEARTVKECKQFAIEHALQEEQASWGKDEVSVRHVDRSIGCGNMVGDGGVEVEGYSNVEVTFERESADPVVHEMAVTGKVVKGSSKLNCTVTKEATRDLLQ